MRGDVEWPTNNLKHFKVFKKLLYHILILTKQTIINLIKIITATIVFFELFKITFFKMRKNLWINSNFQGLWATFKYYPSRVEEMISALLNIFKGLEQKISNI